MNRFRFPLKLTALFLSAGIIFIAGCDKDPFDSGSGSFKDPRDNTKYQWVKIGDQIWMAENLAYLPEVSPSADGSDSETYSYVYGYESTFTATARQTANYELYGVLYNWPFAGTACPEGWHLPTDAEWDVLSNFLGGDSVAGLQLKSKTGWKENVIGNYSTGFNAAPGGYRDNDGGFYLEGTHAGFWTATASDTTNASWVRDLGYNYPDFGRSLYSKTGGFSIRCLKN